MTRVHTFIVAASVTCSMGLFGCGDSDTGRDVPTEQEYNDVAKSFGSVVAAGGDGGDVSSMHDATDLSVGIVPFGFAVDAEGEFNGNRLGLDYNYAVSCKDAQGASLDVCDEDTTDSASVKVSWSGELTIPPTIMAEVERTGSWTLSGIQSGVATLDGDSHFDFDASFMNDNESHAYHFSYTGDYDAIRIQRSPLKVLSGTVHYDIAADRRDASADAGTSTSSFRIDAVLTFNANGDATFTLDGTHTYDLDVATGHVTLRTGG